MQKTKQPLDLGKSKLSKLILKFSVPCVLSLLVSALYNIVDQIFVGNSELSALGNAATGVVFPIFIIAQAFAWWLGDGCAAHVNISQGKNDTKTLHKTVGASMSFTLIISVVILAIFYPLKRQLLGLFGASENTIDMAVEYFNIILGFFPVYMLSNAFNAVIRADGSPTWSMISMLAGAVVNIILDPVFIFGCHLGMAGAAWATVIGQVVSFVISAVYIPRTKIFKLKLKSFIPNFRHAAPTFKLGISSFITQVTIVVIALVCNIMLAKYGSMSKYGPDIPIAIIGIESKVFTVVVNLVVGVVLGCQPLIGYNLGAKNHKRVKALYRAILMYTLGVGIVFTILFEAAPTAVTRIFGEPTNIPNPADYWEFAKKTFRIFLMLVTFTCFIKMSAIFFQASGKPVFATISSLIRDIVCFVPLITTLPLAFGIDGILYSAPIADAVGTAVAVALTIVFFMSLSKSNKAATEESEKSPVISVQPETAAVQEESVEVINNSEE